MKPYTHTTIPYEERLSRLKLPTLEERRERKNHITVTRAWKEMWKVDTEDLFSLKPSKTVFIMNYKEV